MKNRSKPLIISIILVFLLGGFFSNQGLTKNPLEVDAQNSSEEPLRTISVSGMGEVQAQPDLIIVSLGVQTETESARAALDENNTKTQALMEALDEAGIPEENIQTQRFQLTPKYSYDEASDTQKLVGYSVLNMVQVQTSNLDSIGELLDLAVDAGANKIQNIRFEVSDPQSIASQARQAAVEDARSKAEQLASLTGSGLGPVMKIQENSASSVPIEQPAMEVEAASVPIEPGSYRLKINVNITWILIDSTDQIKESPTVRISPQQGQPGTMVQVNATGFPPTTDVEIGVGHWGSEYEVVQSSQTDRQGALNAQVEIPDFANVDEEWVVVVAVESSKPDRLKVTSNRFSVTD